MGDVSTEHLRSSLVSNVIKAGNSFFNDSLFGTCYDSKCRIAIVVQNQIIRKTCKLLACQYAHCPHWVLLRVPSLKKMSLVVVVPHSFNSDQNPYEVSQTAVE